MTADPWPTKDPPPMKSLLALLALLPLAALAETPVTLYGEPCTNTGQCYNVRNDEGLAIGYLTVTCGAGCVAAGINGVYYSSGLNGTDNTPHDGLISIQNAVLYGTDGSQVTLSADLSKQRALCGKYSCWHYTLLDGMVVLL